MFFRKCICKFKIFKIVRPILAAVSVNGLRLDASPVYLYFHDLLSDRFSHHALVKPVGVVAGEDVKLGREPKQL